MFIAMVQTPYIGMHKWTAFETVTYAVDEASEEAAVNAVRSVLGPRDPEVAQALRDQDGYKDGEYFTIWLYQVPDGRNIIPLHEPKRGRRFRL